MNSHNGSQFCKDCGPYLHASPGTQLALSVVRKLDPEKILFFCIIRHDSETAGVPDVCPLFVNSLRRRVSGWSG